MVTFNLLNITKPMKAIKLSRRGKERGLYRFYDGKEYRTFTNHRKYIKALNQHEDYLNLVLNQIIMQDVKRLFKLKSPAYEMEKISERMQLISMCYRFAERGNSNDDYRINNILLDLGKDVCATRKHKKTA